jgi:hypothetical protein
MDIHLLPNPSQYHKLLLDNQLSVHIMCNQDFVTNIRKLVLVRVDPNLVAPGVLAV